MDSPSNFARMFVVGRGLVSKSGRASEHRFHFSHNHRSNMVAGDYDTPSETWKSLIDLGRIFWMSFFTAVRCFSVSNIAAVIWNFMIWVLFRIIFLLQLLLDQPLTYFLENLNRNERVANYSNVNSASTQLFSRDLHNVLAEYGNRPDRFNESNYDAINSELLLLFSALAYESLENCRTHLHGTHFHCDNGGDDHDAEQIEDHHDAEQIEDRHRAREFTIFHSNIDRVVIIAFKGTSPLKWTEWMSDAEIGLNRRQAVQNHFVGRVHTGFHKIMFENGDGALIRTLETRLEQLNLEGDRSEYRIWVTGHSLGAAKCSLFIAYVIRKLSANGSWTFAGFGRGSFKGSYSYGTPRVGDHRFAMDIQRKRFGLEFPVYRVIGSTDIVCRVPLGGSLNERGDGYVLKGFVPELDYYHFGIPVNLYSGPGETIVEKRNNEPVELDIAIQSLNYFFNLGWLFGRDSERDNQIGHMRRFLNPFLNMLDHFPSEYQWRIRRTRQGEQQTNPVSHSWEFLPQALFVDPWEDLRAVVRAMHR
eukprot:TRINITY_DN4613_c0_g1_i2.p1 TRINITY_DN4613_c0_g1~~TRINITY_DN4613_c0_g1_i2.p1  ORF type:complete len:532 (-),score=86.25 TRINITY_DN4613_c0_g1_i2:87-1682(-)